MDVLKVNITIFSNFLATKDDFIIVKNDVYKLNYVRHIKYKVECNF